MAFACSRRSLVADWEPRHAPLACETLLIETAVLGQHQKTAILEDPEGYDGGRVLYVQSPTGLAYSEANLTVVEAIPALRHLDEQRSRCRREALPSLALEQVVRKPEKALNTNASPGLVGSSPRFSPMRHRSCTIRPPQPPRGRAAARRSGRAGIQA